MFASFSVLRFVLSNASQTKSHHSPHRAPSSHEQPPRCSRRFPDARLWLLVASLFAYASTVRTQTIVALFGYHSCAVRSDGVLIC